MKRIKRIIAALGPGFITGASDDDPSGIGTYAQTGALFGYSQLWTSLFSLPFMISIQEMCGRIGLVTGKGLSGVVRTYYSKRLLYGIVFLLIIANTINIGADLGAMAASAQLFIPIPFIFLLLGMTVVTLLLEIFVSYKIYARFLKYLAFTLVAYIFTAFIIKQDWLRVLRSTFIPSFSLSKQYILNIIAILGTTISPYLFFWQADEEVEEEVAHGKLRMMGKGVPKITKKDIKQMRFDTVVGMFFSNLIMFFIILTAASTLGVHGIGNIETAQQAAEALRPLAGNLAFLLFAIGIIGTGLLSVPILAGSASYAVSEAFGWREGLYQKLQKAHGFYGVITIATLIGILINFTPIKPFQMLYYTAILNGIAAPPLMILILRISNNSRIMGTYTNTKFSNVLGLIITFVMGFASLIMLLSVLYS